MIHTNINIEKLKDYIFQLPRIVIIFLKLLYKSYRICISTILFIFNRKYRKSKVKHYKDLIKWREKRISYGEENKDKTFFIIRRISEIEGHCSMVNTVLGHLLRAEKKDYIPIVDMKNYPSMVWQASEKRGLENAWEYFYEQPGGYYLEEINNSKNIVLCGGIGPKKKPNSKRIYFDEKQIRMWNNLYNNYIKFNDETIRYFEKMLKIYNIENNRVLAVSIRRGIEWGHIVNHEWFSSYPKHPYLGDVINKAEELLKLWECDYLFLAIDDQEGLEIFKKKFGDKLLFIERERWVYFKNGNALALEERHHIVRNDFKPRCQENIYNRELNFLTEVFILSRCDCILCSRTTANATAFIMNGGKYKHKYIIKEY
jgi:hypothetical protein